MPTFFLFISMGELYKICQQEYWRLRPLFEKAAGVDLTELRLMKTDDYLRALDAAGTLTIHLHLSLSRNPCTYCNGLHCGVDFDAVVVNEPILFSHPLDTQSPNNLNPSHVIAHELAHAVHFMLDDPCQHKMNSRRALSEFEEGFALYFQTDYVQGIDGELRCYSDEVRDALLLAHETRELNEMVSKFSNPWYKIDGYAFFCRAVEFAGSKEIIFKIIADPPLTMLEMMHPETYLSRVMVDG